MHMEGIDLCNGLELTPNERIRILHDIIGPDSMDGEAVRISGLETEGINLFLSRGPTGVRRMPNIFDNPKQDRVKDLDWCILRGIET